MTKIILLNTLRVIAGAILSIVGTLNVVSLADGLGRSPLIIFINVCVFSIWCWLFGSAVTEYMGIGHFINRRLGDKDVR